jgi:hypothetical protein
MENLAQAVEKERINTEPQKYGGTGTITAKSEGSPGAGEARTRTVRWARERKKGAQGSHVTSK